MLVLLVGAASMLVSRAFGVVAREELKTIVIRDHFILATAFAYVLLLLSARPWYAWLPISLAILGIVALLQPNVNLETVATIAQSGSMLAFLIAWHRSGRQAKLTSSSKSRTTDSSSS